MLTYAQALKTLERAENRMRRAFNAWEKARRAERRLSAKLDRQIVRDGNWTDLAEPRT